MAWPGGLGRYGDASEHHADYNNRADTSFCKLSAAILFGGTVLLAISRIVRESNPLEGLTAGQPPHTALVWFRQKSSLV